MLPEKNLAPKSNGNLSRDRLSEIYTHYIEAVSSLVSLTGRFSPSSFLVYSEDGEKEQEPFIFPLNMDIENIDAVDDVLRAVVKTFPRNRFKLELIMYSQEVANDTDGSSQIVFGARDLAGATVHSIFEKKSDNSVIKADSVWGDFHKWVPYIRKGKEIPENIKPINDQLLEALAVKYAVESSMSEISQ